MGGSEGLMAAGFAAQGVASVGSAYAQSQAIEAQAEFQSQMFEFNKELASYKADDALERGTKSANDLRKQVKQLIGSQRASLAAQGIEIDSGSAAEIQRNTNYMGKLDMLRIKSNAWREAWGYKVEALNYGSQANFASMAAETNSRNTLLTGGLNAAGSLAQASSYWLRTPAPSQKEMPIVGNKPQPILNSSRFNLGVNYGGAR